MEQAVEFTEVLVGAGEQIAQALRCLRTGTELSPAPRRDPSPGERGRPPAARRRRVAVRGRHRPDGRDPLEGHLRVARGGRGRLRDGRARARGHHAQTAAAAALSALQAASAASVLGGALACSRAPLRVCRRRRPGSGVVAPAATIGSTARPAATTLPARARRARRRPVRCCATVEWLMTRALTPTPLAGSSKRCGPSMESAGIAPACRRALLRPARGPRPGAPCRWIWSSTQVSSPWAASSGTETSACARVPAPCSCRRSRRARRATVISIGTSAQRRGGGVAQRDHARRCLRCRARARVASDLHRASSRALIVRPVCGAAGRAGALGFAFELRALLRRGLAARERQRQRAPSATRSLTRRPR